MVKNPLANAGEAASVPGLGRSPGGGHGNPLQCSLLENPVDRGARRATVYGVAKRWTRLCMLSPHQRLSTGLTSRGRLDVNCGSFQSIAQ